MPKATKDTIKEETKNDTIKKTQSKTKRQTTKTKLEQSKTTSVKSKTSTKASTKKTSVTSTKSKTNATKKKTVKEKKEEPISVMEYYDLPYRYNQTVVKILAQTPKMLFVYWDISDKDRTVFLDHYGQDFFEKTLPILLVHNETMNYTYELEINDFANSWYLGVNDANCKYNITLARKAKPFQTIKNQEEHMIITSSNSIDAPNDHILFEKFHSDVLYKNKKTGKTTVKNLGSLSHYQSMEKIYQIYDLYKQIYQNELFDEIVEQGTSNPSSTSSWSK